MVSRQRAALELLFLQESLPEIVLAKKLVVGTLGLDLCLLQDKKFGQGVPLSVDFFVYSFVRDFIRL